LLAIRAPHSFAVIFHIGIGDCWQEVRVNVIIAGWEPENSDGVVLDLCRTVNVLTVSDGAEAFDLRELYGVVIDGEFRANVGGLAAGRENIDSTESYGDHFFMIDLLYRIFNFNFVIIYNEKR